MHHEGLRIGFPEIDPDLVVSSRGSIGLDETLDLHVELPRLDPAQRKEKGPAKCHITGHHPQSQGRPSRTARSSSASRIAKSRSSP